MPPAGHENSPGSAWIRPNSSFRYSKYEHATRETVMTGAGNPEEAGGPGGIRRESSSPERFGARRGSPPPHFAGRRAFTSPNFAS